MSSTLYSMMSSNICVLLTLLIFYYSYSIDAITYYQDCGGEAGRIDSLKVSNCDMKPAQHVFLKKTPRPSTSSRRPTIKNKPTNISNPPISIAKSDPCLLKRGTNITFMLDFTPEIASNTATVKIWGYDIIWIQIPIEPDACKTWGTKCPLAKGVKNMVNMTLPIKPEYPAVSGGIEAILYDDKGDDVACVYFDAKLDDH